MIEREKERKTVIPIRLTVNCDRKGLESNPAIKMIDTADLQAFLEKIQGGTIPVDLLKIGQAHYAQYANAGKLCSHTYTHKHIKLIHFSFLDSVCATHGKPTTLAR